MSSEHLELIVVKKQPMLGVQASDPVESGKKYPWISKITDESPAFGILQLKDHVISLNGIDMKNKPYKVVHEIVRATEVGDKLRFIVKRSKRQMMMGSLTNSLSSLTTNPSLADAMLSPPANNTNEVFPEDEELPPSKFKRKDSLSDIDLSTFGGGTSGGPANTEGVIGEEVEY